MLDTILGSIIKNHIIIKQIKHNVWEIFNFHLHIRTNTATITHFTSGCCMEYIGQAVRSTGHRPVSITFSIINSLNASSAGNIIFCSSYFHATVIRQFTRNLYQPFTIRTASYHNSPIKVLQGT